MKIHILSDYDWDSLQKIPDPLNPGKFAYILPDNLNELGKWKDL